MKLNLKWGFALLIIAGAVTGGCASPHLVPQTPSHRMGFLDRAAHWESAHTSKKHKFGFLAPSKESHSEDVPELASRKGEVLSSKDARAHAVEVRSDLSGVGGLKWPLSTVSVTSEFGQRGGEFHEGVDLKASKGTPIYASQSGRVLYADSRIRGYGKMVVIQHVKDLATVYAHISKILVRRGQRVIQGQKIALTGQTGRAHGPHLHFETRRGLAAINPLKILPLARAAAHHLAVNR
jgi:murein DD-endopeptidase MepM/ murein hydrolase activator NlpD